RALGRLVRVGRLLGGLAGIFGRLQRGDQGLIFRITFTLIVGSLGQRLFRDDAAVLGQGLDQLAVNARRAGHDFALVQVVGLAGKVADQTTSLGDDERTGGN